MAKGWGAFSLCQIGASDILTFTIIWSKKVQIAWPIRKNGKKKFKGGERYFQSIESF